MTSFWAAFFKFSAAGGTTVILYLPGSNSGTVKVPSSPVFTVRSAAVSILVTVTIAF